MTIPRTCPVCGGSVFADGGCPKCQFPVSSGEFSSVEQRRDRSEIETADLIPSQARDGQPKKIHQFDKIRYVGDYEVLGEIAHGGMGVIYRARQMGLNRLVALKMIRSGEFADAKEIERFRGEAEAAANLDHAHIVPIYEIGEHNGQQYFSMKLIEGDSLNHCLNRFENDFKAIADLMNKLARAVHHAHNRGIIHRDLKPGNILIDAAGQPHITDFGLARRMESPKNLTQTGAIVGTPEYMAPEQASAKKQLTKSVDIWSLGAVLYTLLTGRPPFEGQDLIETLVQVCEREPIPPRTINAKTPGDLETICLKCLAKEPEQRYSSALKLASDLDHFRQGRPIAARRMGRIERTAKWVRRRPAVAALLLAVLVAIVGISWALGVASQESQLAEQRETRANWLAYAANLAKAREELQTGNSVKAREHLAKCPREFRGWEFAYLWTAANTKGEDIAILGVHQRPAPIQRSLVFSPDGKHLASIVGFRTDRFAFDNTDSEIKLWDVETLEEISTLREHKSGIWDVAFRADGKHLVSAHDDGILKLWNLHSGEEVATFANPLPMDNRGVDVQHGRARNSALSSDGQMLTGVGGRVVRVWDISVEKRKLALRWQNSESSFFFNSVAISPDSSRVAAFGWLTARDGAAPVGLNPFAIRIFDARSGANLRTIRANVTFAAWGNWRYTGRISYTADGKQIVTRCDRGNDLMSLNLWDADSGQEVATWIGGSPATLSSDGTRIVTLNDKTLRIHNTMNLELLSLRGGGMATAFSPDTRRIASVDSDGTVKLWTSNTGWKEAPQINPAASETVPFAGRFIQACIVLGIAAAVFFSRTWPFLQVFVVWIVVMGVLPMCIARINEIVKRKPLSANLHRKLYRAVVVLSLVGGLGVALVVGAAFFLVISELVFGANGYTDYRSWWLLIVILTFLIYPVVFFPIKLFGTRRDEGNCG